MRVSSFAILRHLIIALLLTLVVGPATRSSADEQRLAERSMKALPAQSLAVLVVHDVAHCEQLLRPTLQQFGLPPLPVGTFVSSLAGSDPAGPLMLGLAASVEGPPTLFLMIPVKDFETFSSSLGGEARAETSEIELAGQRLLARHRDKWALISNTSSSLADEMYDPAEPLIRAISPHFATEGSGSLSLLVPDDGLARMALAIKETEKTPQEIDRLRRRFRVSAFRWLQPADWQELILVYGPVVESLSAHTSGAVVQVQITPAGGATIDGSLLTEQTATSPPSPKIEEAQLPSLQIPDRPLFLTLKGPSKTPWTPMAIELFLGHLASRGDDLGIVEYPLDEWEAFRQSVHSLVEETRGLSLTAVAPREQEPQLANQAMLLEVADSARFLRTAQELTTDWNRLVENAKREVDLVFDARPIESEGHVGKRFAVDLPFAFQANQIPEVRNVLAALFGNTGEMRIDVLPLDPTHVVISQFPPEVTAQIVSGFKALPQANPASRWDIEFAPQVFQDWQNATFKASFEGNIVGWRPRRFESAETISLRVTPAVEAARIEVELSAEVLKSWAKFMQSK